MTLDTLHKSEIKILEAIEFFNRSAPYAFLATQLGRLRTVMARTNESNQDLTLLIDTYAENLKEYPPDIIKAVCADIIQNHKWFPLVIDIRKKADAMMAFRRAVLKCFEQKSAPRIAPPRPPEPQKDWKEIPKDKWDIHMWQAYVGEAEGMVRLAEQNPSFLDGASWQAEVDKRKALKVAAMVGTAAQN